MKNKKMNLGELSVKSFVTSIDGSREKTIKGGVSETIEIPDSMICRDPEPTGLGASCEWTMCDSHECQPV